MQGKQGRGNHFLVQGSILAAASIIVRFIGLIYRIPMTNIIGDEGMGLYNISFEMYNMALILSSYSLPIAVSKLVAARTINKEYRNSYRIFLCAMGFAMVVGLAATLLIFFGADFFAVVINNEPGAALPLKVLAPTIFVFSIMGVFRGFYQGKNTTIPTSVSQIIEQIVNAIVSVGAAYLLVTSFDASPNVATYGAAGGTLGTFIGAFVGLIFLIFVFTIYKPTLKKQVRKDTSHYRESYSDIFKLLILTIAPIVLSQTVYHISGTVDNSMFGNIMDAKRVQPFEHSILGSLVGHPYTKEARRILLGIYSNKYRVLSNLPVGIAAAFGAAIIPSITAAKIKGMDDVIRNRTRSAIKFNMIIAIPSAVGMGVLASPILKMLFHDSSDLSANFLRIGSIAIVFYALSTVTNSVLQGINKLRTPVINSAISLAIHVVLVFVLLRFTNLSAYALVIGNVSFALVICILNWISIKRSMQYHQEVKKTFLIPFLSAILMGIATYFTYQGVLMISGSNSISTLASLGIAVIVYFIFLILLKGLSEEELQFLPKGRVFIRLLKKLHLL